MLVSLIHVVIEVLVISTAFGIVYPIVGIAFFKIFVDKNMTVSEIMKLL